MLRFARACGYLTAMRTRRENDPSAFDESMGSLLGDAGYVSSAANSAAEVIPYNFARRNSSVVSARASIRGRCVWGQTVIATARALCSK
jgi:hypothetical protein